MNMSCLAAGFRVCIIRLSFLVLPDASLVRCETADIQKFSGFNLISRLEWGGVHGVWIGLAPTGYPSEFVGYLCTTGMTGWRPQRALDDICFTLGLNLS
jgi:hypothetical protein